MLNIEVLKIEMHIRLYDSCGIDFYQQAQIIHTSTGDLIHTYYIDGNNINVFLIKIKLNVSWMVRCQLWILKTHYLILNCILSNVLLFNTNVGQPNSCYIKIRPSTNKIVLTWNKQEKQEKHFENSFSPFYNIYQ